MGISGWQLLVLLLIVVLVFGTKKLRTIGSDLGSAMRDFRKGMSEDPDAKSSETTAQSEQASNSSESDTPKA